MLNISRNPNVCLVFDQYDEDWGKLAYVIVYGRAKILLKGKEHQHAVRLLKRKYRQYKTMSLENRPVIKITPTRMVSWKYEGGRREISG
jgi:PPOX class probable F420-dependent enzyme